MTERPLSTISFEVLLSLADGEHHGYEIMRDIEERTRQTVHPGTLYRTVARLVEEGLLEELADRPAPELDDERRRYYALTPDGRVQARREAERLAAQVRTARAKKLLGKTRA